MGAWKASKCVQSQLNHGVRVISHCRPARTCLICNRCQQTTPMCLASLVSKPCLCQYYEPVSQTLDFGSFNAAIAALPEQSVIVLQSSSQNPTGCDPSPEQWRQLADTFKRHGHFAFFDAAYLGFVSGDAFVDAESIRIFADAEVPLLIAATYGKAFGLYGERVGFLSVVAPRVGGRQ